MIQVVIDRDAADQRIIGFKVDGHADYADPGKDIVCSAVSAVTVGTVNAIEQLVGVAPDSKMDKGLLHVITPVLADAERNRQTQLLLSSMIIMLETIEQSYGKFLNIQVKSIKEGG